MDSSAPIAKNSRTRNPNIRIVVPASAPPISTDQRRPSIRSAIPQQEVTKKSVSSANTPDVDTLMNMGQMFQSFLSPTSPMARSIMFSPTHIRSDFDEVFAEGGNLMSPLSPRSPMMFSPSAASPVALDGGRGSSSIVNSSANLLDEEGGKGKRQGSLRLLYSYAQGADHFFIFMGSLLSVIYGILIAFMPYIYGVVYDEFTRFGQGLSTKDEFLQKTLFNALIFLALSAGIFLMALCSQYLWSITGYRQYTFMTSAYIRSVLDQEIAWFDVLDVENGGTGGSTNLGIVSALKNARIIQTALSEPMPIIIQCASAIITAFILAMLLSWKLASVVFAILPILSLIMAMANAAANASIKRCHTAMSDESRYVDEVLTNIRTVFASNAVEYENRIHSDYSSKYTRERKSLFRRWAGLSGCTQFMMIASFALAYWYGGLLIFGQEVTSGAVLSIVVMSVIASENMARLSYEFPQLVEAIQLFLQLDSVIRRKSRISSAATDGCNLENCKGGIEFRSVSFNYPSRPESLIYNRLSFAIRPESFVGIVGSSGSGKSTLSQLLLRFYDPTEGSVLIDGIDIRKLNPASVHANIMVVTQEPFLYDMSIRKNLLLEAPSGVSEEDLRNACKLAGSLEFIESLPNGFDTNVGECGDQLSGGQKQRIMLARIFLTKRKIIILDEATSHLDLVSEETVLKNIRENLKHKTILAIAHRVRTVANADEIFVMVNGSIVERGVHGKLIAVKNGIYQKYYNLNEMDKKMARDTVFEVGRFSIDGWKKSMDMPGRISVLGRASTESEAPVVATSALPAFAWILKRGSINWRQLIPYAITTIVLASSIPTYSYLLSRTFDNYSSVIGEGTDAQRRANVVNVILFLGLATLKGFGTAAKMLFSGTISANLGHSLRKLAFNHVLSRKVAWFDNADNTPDILSTRIVHDTVQIQLIISSIFPSIFEALAVGLIGLVISAVFGWRLLLVLLPCCMIIALFSLVQGRLLGKFERSLAACYEKSESFVAAFVSSIRNVNAFNLQNFVADEYTRLVWQAYGAGKRKGAMASLSNALSISLIYASEALCFFYGSVLVSQGLSTVNEILLVFTAIIFSAAGVAHSLSIGQSVSKALSATNRFKKLIKVYHSSDEVQESTNEEIEIRKIEFSDVTFAYPARPTVNALNGVSFKIRAGEKVALVGRSGEGKSTILSLIEGFYNATKGTVYIGNKNIKRLDIVTLRSRMAWVEQSPSLFNRTIRENILYGNWSRFETEPVDPAIEKMSAMLNLDSFVDKLPGKYDTLAGTGGSQLSGGERQRVVIARTCLKKPDIYLMDEYTSALDNANAASIIDCINTVTEGKICLIITHNLNTLRQVDRILFLKNGKIEESGTHETLMAAKKGYYDVLKDQLV